MAYFLAIFLFLFASRSLASLSDIYDTPRVFEVQLISPRNGTWEPTANMPIIFAIKNPRLASPLGVSYISWRFAKLGTFSDQYSDSGDIKLQTLNGSTPSPYIAIDHSSVMGKVEAEWVFVWDISFSNCSNDVTDVQDEDGREGRVATTNIWRDGKINRLQFTTRNATTAMSVEAAMSSDDTCRLSDTIALNVHDLLPLPGWIRTGDQSQWYAPTWRPSCANLGPTPTTASSCAFNGTTRSSVAAQVSYYGCKSNCTLPGERSAASSSNCFNSLLFAVLLCMALGVILN
ncbi:uncharacterized protein K489DRAFT_371508 [Dissoconium aciculare CBS 342.82]|uniref:DUF7136 domain-containing protein n=1 Tax=Dissoconium aciculare CBS 342.82 TaxID=1314786 RepID=A0A6J3M0D3_9PEZI|nr:uncharacterized protein K489DRAFT_371508 [Dissoconium aciculare CBS 342.82]KAF1821495.1 hypothetical protein K489DRAFT_371508 [Dissoconium aciculare CBS 342.82]